MRQEDRSGEASQSGSEVQARITNAVHGMRALIIQNIISAFLGFVVLAALVRLLPPVQYGLYSAVVVVTTIATPVATLGLSYAATRYVSLSQKSNQEGAGLWNSTTKSILILCLILSGFSTVAIIWICPYLSLYFMKTEVWLPAFQLGSLSLLSGSISGVLLGFIQGLRKYSLLANMYVVSKVVTVSFTVIGLLLYSSVYVAIVAGILYGVLLIVWPLKFLWHSFFAASSPETNKHGYSELLGYSIPLGVAGLLGVTNSYADVVVVGGYLGAVPLGIYNAAITIFSALGIILLTPLTTLIFPEVASSSDKESELRNVLRLSFRFVMLVVLPVSMLLAGLSTQVITLFSGGGVYLSGAVPLAIIASFYLLAGLATSVYLMLQGLGRTHLVLILAAFNAALDIGSSILLVPHFGLLGAAFTKALVDVFGFLLTLYLGRAYLKGLDGSSFYLKSLVPSLGILTLTSGLSVFLSDRTLTIVPYTIGALCLYLVLTRALGIFTDEDRLYISLALPKPLKKITQII